jgi:hypothetical protein
MRKIRIIRILEIIKAVLKSIPYLKGEICLKYFVNEEIHQ